jgi:hypothetical protein
MLEDKYHGVDMPDDGKTWVHIGFCYQNADNVNDNERCYQHPNREFLIQRYLDEINADFSAFNRQVDQEVQQDNQKYDDDIAV